MGWLVDWLSRLAETAQRDYDVSAPVFIAIFVASVPVFYVALAVAAKEVIRLRRQSMPLRSGRLSISVAVLALSWLSPYVYVMIWGHDLPWYVWAVIATLLVVGAIRLGRSIRVRMRK